MPSEPTACTCSALRKAARHASRFYDRALEPVGLGINQYAILIRLHRQGPTTLQALADGLAADRSTVGHLVRPLEARGVLTIVADGDDRRRRLLALTGEGTAVLERARPLWAVAQARFEGAFGATETAGLHDVLARVVATSLQSAPEGTRP